MTDRKYVYCGPKRIPRIAEPSKGKIPTGALSSNNAKVVLLRAWTQGTVRFTTHFKMRGIERGFTTIDAETLMRVGTVQGKGEFCPIRNNFKYRLRGLVEERMVEMVFALDPTTDYVETPLAIFVTGYVKKPRG